jgi:hypothetical protein
VGLAATGRIETHDRFAEDRSRIFIGRDAVLKTIADYIRGPERRPLVFHGQSGSGKSAVMAKASQQSNGPRRVKAGSKAQSLPESERIV